MTIKGIPEDVLQRFKAWCALHGMSLSKALIDYMRIKGETVELRSADK